MSGIAGVFNLNGAPVDARLVASMADALRFRGPDARTVWVDGNVGFAHTLLCTNEGASPEVQPCSLDGAVWIVADARVDARAELVTALAAKERTGLASASDAELILHAYAVWSEACLDHLLGDFAFAIWDGPRRRLFCARDQMGVKPLFYTQVAHAFIFSNSLDCIRLHPLVSTRLDDLAIADFLLFGYRLAAESTTFADIRRLAAGHCATVSASGVRIRRYWELPIDEPIYFRHKADYADRFNQLLHAAVADRLRTTQVGVFMSGGLDSTTLAATARDLLRASDSLTDVRAYTIVHDYPSLDPERYYASLAANHLGIPIDFRVMSEEPFESPADIQLPEPAASPWEAIAERKYYSRIAQHSRVVLYGEGPDNALLYEWQAYLVYLRKQHAWARMFGELLSHAIAHRRVPLLSTLPRMLKQRYVRSRQQAEFPAWLNQDLISNLQLRDRWFLHTETVLPGVHPVRPRAFNSLRSVLWQRLFEEYDAANTGAPLEVRHPYVDLRLLRFMLAVPVLPWCRVKYLIRYAMGRSLPQEILRRPKTPLAGAPVFDKARRSGLPAWQPSELLVNYVDIGSLMPAVDDGPMVLMDKLRVAGLSSWLETHSR